MSVRHNTSSTKIDQLTGKSLTFEQIDVKRQKYLQPSYTVKKRTPKVTPYSNTYIILHYNDQRPSHGI